MHDARLQQVIDDYLHQRDEHESAYTATTVFEHLVQYLVHFSDLFRDPEFDDAGDFSDWEENLEEQMMHLLEGDIEPVHDLGQVPLSRLQTGHVRDFMAWFLLRESASSDSIQTYAEELARWFAYLQDTHRWTPGEYLDFFTVLNEVTPEASRASRLARILYYYVRSGSAMSPHARGKRFTAFAEGHARVHAVDDEGIVFHFDSQQRDIGPVALPKAILELVETGDVFDVELGQRGEQWYIVDMGPVYPGCVYVEAEELQGLDKIS